MEWVTQILEDLYGPLQHLSEKSKKPPEHDPPDIDNRVNIGSEGKGVQSTEKSLAVDYPGDDVGTRAEMTAPTSAVTEASVPLTEAHCDGVGVPGKPVHKTVDTTMARITADEDMLVGKRSLDGARGAEPSNMVACSSTGSTVNGEITLGKDLIDIEPEFLSLLDDDDEFMKLCMEDQGHCDPQTSQTTHERTETLQHSTCNGKV